MLPVEKPAPPEGAPRRQPAALHFPVAAEVPETKRHLELRTLLYLVLRTLADEHSIGCDQFVYWDPTDPSRCLAPDAFVRIGVPDSIFTSWKTWERGVPDVAVEITSDSDASALAWDVKLRRYQELGIRELVRFDADEAPERQVRIWDRVEGALIERQAGETSHFCRGLKLFWVVVPAGQFPAALRLARDAEGRDLVLTPEERSERARQAEAQARQAAEQRVAELEAELRRRGG
jgi:hypothetical protein